MIKIIGNIINTHIVYQNGIKTLFISYNENDYNSKSFIKNIYNIYIYIIYIYGN
jgi:hypothetical protein